MSKKIFSLLLAVMLVVSMFSIATVSVFADTDADGRYVPSTTETRRYYFAMPDDWFNEKTSDAGVYWWAGTDACPTWQDMYKAQKADRNNVFYVDCPVDVTTIIWTNLLDAGDGVTEGVGDLAKQTVNIQSEYYDEGESDLYPDGIAEEVGFDNMIFVCTDIQEVVNEYTGLTQTVYGGDWYYYFGEGKYGSDPEGANAVVFPEYGTVVEPTEPSTTEPAVEAGTVNGETIHVGDEVTYTVTLTANEVLENVQGYVDYDASVLSLRESSDVKTDILTALPVIGPAGTVWNTNLENKVKFNASSLMGYDFTQGGVLVNFTFDVVGLGDVTIATTIEEMNGSEGTCFASNAEVVTEYTAAETVAVKCNLPEPTVPETTVPETTAPIVTDPATTAPAEEAETTAPASEEAEATTVADDASNDQAPTTTPNVTGGESDGNGTVQTGDVTFAVALLVLLVVASGAMFIVRKRVNG